MNFSALTARGCVRFERQCQTADAISRGSWAPLKVLHVSGGMVYGGIETWLMHVLRNIDRQRVSMDFLVNTDRECPFDREIEQLGARLVRCPEKPERWLRTLRRRLTQVLRDHGPYDVVHSHRRFDDGLVLGCARSAGVAVRISHSHNDTRPTWGAHSPLRRAYHSGKRLLVRRHMTLGLACSSEAAAGQFGPDWASDPRCHVLPYSIDLSPFRKDVDRHAVRQSLGIGQSELVIGHAGRFVPQKNHEFVIEVMRELVRREPSSRLLLVGDGPLRPAMEQRVIAAGLSGVIFAGTRADVPAIMRCAMDAFLFPSHHEGLPLVLVEAQAANLPCIHTDSLSTEVVCNNPLMHPMPLSASPRAWGEKALDCARRRRANEQDSQAAVDLVDRSGFNIQTAVHRLADIYARAAGVATWGRATVV